MPRPMIVVSLLFILGIIIQTNFSIPLGLLGFLAAIGITTTLFRRESWLLILLLIISGCLRVAIGELNPSSHLSKFITQLDSAYVVRAVVLDVGETRKGTPKFLLGPTQINQQHISGGSMLLYSKDIEQVLNRGDTLVGQMIINSPRGKRNPHEFDYREYLKERGIYFEAFLEQPEDVIIYPSDVNSVSLIMFDVQEKISNHFHKYLTPRSAGILSALILGEKSEIEETTRNDFANTGVIHVLAVSGLHVGYVSLILITIFGLFRLPHHIQMGSVILGLLFYVGLTGAAPSVMRASIMASLMIVGGLIERKSDIFNILASAAFIILLISPNQLSNLGFQLSFLAVFSIVTLFPIFKEWVNRLPVDRNTPIGKMILSILDLFLVSLAAQLGTLAITIFYFNKIPIISLLANLVVVPLIGVIVATGMSFLILGSLIPFLAPLWAATIEGAIDFMLWFVRLCAQIDWAYVTTRPIQSFELLIILVGIFVISVVKYRVILKLWLVLLITWLSLHAWQSILTPQHLELVVLDVGQGDAILIHAPNGKTILIDTGLRFGGKDMGKDVIVPYLRHRNWSKIDLLVLTHPHNDHIGGAQYLLENVPVGKVFMPDIEYESYGYNALKETIIAKHIPHSAVFAGHIDSTLKPIYFRVTGPKSYDTSSQPSNVNNTSIVMQLFYGASNIMLTGDGEELVEHNQLALGLLLRSDIIKTPHHGSKTSSSQEYIDLVQPRVCLISLGMKNKFRHPSPITIDRYKELGAEIHRTDLEGCQIYKSDGRAWYRHDWKDEE